jgi:hypothetical protein
MNLQMVPEPGSITLFETLHSDSTYNAVRTLGSILISGGQRSGLSDRSIENLVPRKRLYKLELIVSII